jgi:hypothetical protein
LCNNVFFYYVKLLERTLEVTVKIWRILLREYLRGCVYLKTKTLFLKDILDGKSLPLLSESRVNTWLKLNSIFEEYYKELNWTDDLYVPGIPPEIKKGGIIEIGMNPSMNDKDFYNKELKNFGRPFVHFCKWENRKDFDVHLCAYVEQRIEDNEHLYFRKIKKMREYVRNQVEKDELLSKYMNHLSFTHMDMLHFRKTNQKPIPRYKRVPKENTKGFPRYKFYRDQLNVTMGLLKNSEPLLIIVYNKGVSDYIKETFELEYDANYDCNKIKIGDNTFNIKLLQSFSGRATITDEAFSYIQYGLWNLTIKPLIQSQLNS